MNSSHPPPPAPTVSSPDVSPAPSGTVKLFTFRGIRVFLHWTWAIIALWQIERGKGFYDNWLWAGAEYLSLFGIVLLHEFGHAFATRQTGGRADTILLWPFGGIAFVQAPPRPGAHLWGLAAGPLVNVALWPVFYALYRWMTPGMENADAAQFLGTLFYINTGLLIFNMLPIYPLDGGQILRTLLWFKFGPLNSLRAATTLGLVLGAALGLYAAVWLKSLWLAVIAGLIVFQCWKVLQQTLFIRRQLRERGVPEADIR